MQVLPLTTRFYKNPEKCMNVGQLQKFFPFIPQASPAFFLSAPWARVQQASRCAVRLICSSSRCWLSLTWKNFLRAISKFAILAFQWHHGSKKKRPNSFGTGCLHIFTPFLTAFSVVFASGANLKLNSSQFPSPDLHDSSHHFHSSRKKAFHKCFPSSHGPPKTPLANKYGSVSSCVGETPRPIVWNKWTHSSSAEWNSVPATNQKQTSLKHRSTAVDYFSGPCLALHAPLRPTVDLVHILCGTSVALY